jgi:hypothetical protein
MHVTSYDAVLALHIIVVMASFMMAAAIHALLFQMRWARDVSALENAPRALRPLERLLPLGALAVLGSGAWLVHLSGGAVRWSDGWVVASLTALVVVEAVAGVVSRPRSERLQAAIRASLPGPVPPELRSLVTDPVLWLVTHLATATFVGVVFVMATKPSGLWSVAVIAGAAVLGIVSALPAFREHSSGGQAEQSPARAA